MDKYIKCSVSVCLLLLAGCVTQNFENDKSTPVVQNESTNNDIAMTRISLGLGYLKMGNTTQAKLNLEKAKRFSPNLVQVYTAFAHYYDTVGEPTQAITAYEKALSIKSDDADTLNNYGVFLCKQKQYQKAEQQILKAIAVPSYILVAQSYENLALCQLQANDFVKTELYLSKAIQHSPSNASALLQMIRLQYAKGAYKAADNYLKLYEKATRHFSPNALALAYKLFTKQHNIKMAKNYGTMLVKMFPKSYESKQYLLNGLREIEADRLAMKYKSLQASSMNTKPKKRTVKLSPTRASERSLSVTKLPAKKASKNNSVIMKKMMGEMSKGKPKQTQNGASKVLLSAKKSSDPGKAKIPKKPATTNEHNNQKMLTLPIHVIGKGDSLFSISRKYNIHMKSIERWNGIKRNKVLRIGDVIYLANPKKLAKSEGNG